VLIVQSEPFNRSRIQTVMAAILTTNLNLSHAPGNVALPMSETGLPRDSVVNVSQVVTLDKGFLLEKAGRLSRKRLEAVDDGLRLALGL
jgi:mRNA interferase MazF